MTTDSERIDRLEYYIDAIGGLQTALTVMTALLAQPHIGNATSIQAFTSAFERTRAGMLGSRASDYKIAAFDSAANDFLERLNG